MNKHVAIQGLNIQYPWSQLIMDSRKTIETRNYSCPIKFLNIPILLIETKNPNVSDARAIGIFTIEKSIAYKNSMQYQADQEKHLVYPGSEFYWSNTLQKKFGWHIGATTQFKTPIEVPRKRGYVWTTPIQIPNSLIKPLFEKLLQDKTSS